MYYQQPFNRGMLQNKQMFSRLISPAGAFSYARGAGPIKEGIPRTVEMPGSRGIRHQHHGGRHMYYNPQRMQTFPTMPQGYSSLLQPHQPPGNYFYHPPEDPRALAFAAPQTGMYPYLTSPAQFQPQAFRAPVTAYGGMPYHQGAGFTPFHMHTPVQSNHLPQPLGGNVPYQEIRPTRERSDTADSSGSARFTDSPGSGIQMLPNVKHLPPHLLGKPGNSSPEASGSSAGSPPVNISHGAQSDRVDDRVAALSNRSYSPANYTSEISGSGERLSVRSFSPGDYAKEQVTSGDDRHSRQQSYSPGQFAHDSSSVEDFRSSGERSLSISPPVTSKDHSAKQIPSSSPANDLKYNNNNNNEATTRLNTRRKTPNLRLRTGFSRQYSDGLPTPTVITNMIQMIDDNIDEDSAEDESSTVRGDRRSTLRLKMTMAEKLQHQQVLEANEASSSSTPPSAEDYHPSYPRMIQQNDQRRTITAEDAAQLEIQTPRTPKGFITPGADVEVDPFGILKSLNIGGTPQ